MLNPVIYATKTVPHFPSLGRSKTVSCNCLCTKRNSSGQIAGLRAKPHQYICFVRSIRNLRGSFACVYVCGCVCVWMCPVRGLRLSKVVAARTCVRARSRAYVRPQACVRACVYVCVRVLTALYMASAFPTSKRRACSHFRRSRSSSCGRATSAMRDRN